MLISLSTIATISTNMEDADFWLQRRGSIKTVGKPSRRKQYGFEYNAENIGIKFHDNCIVDSGYMYWVFVDLHQKGIFKQLANGTTDLVSIKVSDIKRFGF